MTHEPCIFANTACKQKDVAAAHLGHVTTDVAFYALCKHIECVGASFVTSIASCTDVAHILLATADTNKTALLVEDIGYILHGLAFSKFLLYYIKNCTRVNITWTATHDKAFESCETHCGVNRLSVVNCSNRSTATEVAANYLEVFPVLANHLGSLFCYKAVACSVEAVATEMILLVVFVWQTIEERLRRKCLVESGIEYNCLRNIRQYFAHSVDTCQVTGSMKRCEFHQRLNLFDYIVVNESTSLEKFATVSNAVTYSFDFLQVLDYTHFRVGESLENHSDTGCMVCNWSLFVVLLSVVLVGEFSHFEAYSFEKTFCHYGRIVVSVNVDELVFN